MKIIAMPVDEGGCGQYRIRQPVSMLNQFTEHQAHVIEKTDDFVEVARAMTVSDIAVFRSGGEEGMRSIRAIPELKHVRWVLDIDDNIEEIDPLSVHFEEYGTRLPDHPELRKLLIEHPQAINFEANKARVASLLFSLQEADLVTVTTPKLAEYARQYNDKVAVLPNMIDTRAWWKLPLKPNTPLRIGWSGGMSHYIDWLSIQEPLNELMAKYDFTLVSIGSAYQGILRPEFRHRLEIRPWVPFHAHSYRMMAMALDIAIIPLADITFNDYKSAVKWYEFSAMSVPAVVANKTPYKEEITDGVTACAYNNPQEFYTKLEALILNAELRETIGNNARSWVVANRDAKTNAALWPEAYRAILT